MTASAQQFVTPLSFRHCLANRLRTTLWDGNAEQAMGHIELARWAERVLIAPASADVIARLAHGLADDLVTTLCLATTAPLITCPAMNHNMMAASSDPGECCDVVGAWCAGHRTERIGPLAEGVSGLGRMSEPEAIVVALVQGVSPAPVHGGLFHGQRIVISAGPTFEDLDPVRYLGNRSSGEDGFCFG